MLTSKMLNGLSGWLKSGKQVRKLAKRSCRPEVEGLEDRTVPTIVFTPRYGAEQVHDDTDENVLRNVPIRATAVSR
jgi:hypothetical protein